MKIDKPRIVIASIAGGTGILSESMIPFGIDDDDGFTTKDGLRNQQVEQTCLADPGASNNQGMTHKVSQLRK